MLAERIVSIVAFIEICAIPVFIVFFMVLRNIDADSKRNYDESINGQKRASEMFEKAERLYIDAQNLLHETILNSYEAECLVDDARKLIKGIEDKKVESEKSEGAENA